MGGDFGLISKYDGGNAFIYTGLGSFFKNKLQLKIDYEKDRI